MGEEMAVRSSGAAARLVGAVVLLALIAVSEASAGNFYWQARRSSEWSHGINAGGVSNWYTLPAPNGVARNAPGINDTAIFARGARSYAVTISQTPTQIGKILVPVNAPQYNFNVAPHTTLSIHGAGLFNRSAVPPRFYVRGLLALTNDARLFSYTAARPALVFLSPNGALSLQRQSKGGNALVRNTGGSIGFLDDSSADRMTLTNIASFGANPPSARIDFDHRSTGGSAHIINQHNGIVNFTRTLGPAGNGRVSAGRIDNFGHLFIGTRAVILSGGLTLEIDGVYGDLNLNIFQTRAGHIQVAKRAILGGRINITGTQVVGGRSYAIVTAGEGVIGRFDDVFLSGVSGRLIYGANAVLLYVDP
jgi:hypothetical protein